MINAKRELGVRGNVMMSAAIVTETELIPDNPAEMRPSAHPIYIYIKQNKKCPLFDRWQINEFLYFTGYNIENV